MRTSTQLLTRADIPVQVDFDLMSSGLDVVIQWGGGTTKLRVSRDVALGFAAAIVKACGEPTPTPPAPPKRRGPKAGR